MIEFGQYYDKKISSLIEADLTTKCTEVFTEEHRAFMVVVRVKGWKGLVRFHQRTGATAKP
jgi:hypothetical protein